MRQIALIETDLAAIARAETALQRLDAGICTLCERRPTEELIETLRGAYHDLVVAIAIAKSYVASARRSTSR